MPLGWIKFQFSNKNVKRTDRQTDLQIVCPFKHSLHGFYSSKWCGVGYIAILNFIFKEFDSNDNSISKLSKNSNTHTHHSKSSFSSSRVLWFSFEHFLLIALHVNMQNKSPAQGSMVGLVWGLRPYKSISWNE